MADIPIEDGVAVLNPSSCMSRVATHFLWAFFIILADVVIWEIYLFYLAWIRIFRYWNSFFIFTSVMMAMTFIFSLFFLKFAFWKSMDNNALLVSFFFHSRNDEKENFFFDSVIFLDESDCFHIRVFHVDQLISFLNFSMEILWLDRLIDSFTFRVSVNFFNSKDTLQVVLKMPVKDFVSLWVVLKKFH